MTMTSSYPAIEEPRSSLFDTKRKSIITEDFPKEITNEDLNKLGNFQQETPTPIQSKNQYPEKEEIMDKDKVKQTTDIKKDSSQSKINTQQNKGNTTNTNNSTNNSNTNISSQQKNKSVSVSNNQVDNKQVQKSDDGYETIIKCVKIGGSVLTESQNVTITISAPEKHSGGFFQSDYITYSVYTDPLNYKVRRRYSDFEWLRGILLDFFPGSMIPPIPGKNFGDRLQEGFIEKRMRYLQVILLLY